MAKDRASRRAQLRRQTAEQANATDSKREGKQAFAQEYAYVLKDLRRVFALAAIMFVLLIILNIALL
ncbi:MAG: hypothetical protein H6654_18770 [Ardenticatenaceae bacterium]|nr:hypothetical protein [Anaerolineales bacterium]MCB8938245.1 hypothetical protein [Ardenticatenaceae bacterium]MCB8975610.1 hypothetical protein [Ardenticatenaceae bacterium]